MYDKNGDGTLNELEFARALKELNRCGLNSQHIENMVTQIYHLMYITCNLNKCNSKILHF